MTPNDIPLVILGVPFNAVDNAQTLDWCLEHIKRGKPGYVATPNLDFVMQAGKDPELYRILTQADLVIADGMPIVWLSRMLGPKLPERVAGSDLVLSLSEVASHYSYSVFNLGGAPGVPEKAGEILAERFPGFKLAGAYSPPKADLLEMDHQNILDRLSTSKPDILYVAFGGPKQEKWINMHYRDWDVPLALGIGGSLDFLAGAQTRAPKWMQKSGTEWIWRLGTNPSRLWKRYGSNLLFLFQSFWKMKKIKKQKLDPQPARTPPEKYASYFKFIKWQPQETREQACAFLESAIQEPTRQNLLLDFSEATWLSSLELGVLLRLGWWGKQQNCQILLTGLPGRLAHWIQLNGINNLLQILKTEIDWQNYIEIAVSGFVATSPTYGTLRLIPPVELTAATLPDWREKVQPILQKRSDEIKRIEVDASGLKFLDSAGLGYLVRICQEVKAQSMEWKLLHLEGAALITLKLARVEKILLS